MLTMGSVERAWPWLRLVALGLVRSGWFGTSFGGREPAGLLDVRCERGGIIEASW